jgi:hypothetical protein
MQTQHGDAPLPYELAFNRFIEIGGIQSIMEDKASFIRELIEIHGEEKAIEMMKDIEIISKRINKSVFPLTAWKDQMAKAIDWNKPRDDYERRYGIYPDIDPVMQAWEASNRTGKVDASRENANR